MKEEYTETLSETTDCDDLLYPGLSNFMELAVAIKPNGDFWLVHDESFPDKPLRAEYSVNTGKLTLVSETGFHFPVDLTFNATAQKRLLQASTVFIIHMEQQKHIKDTQELDVLIKN